MKANELRIGNWVQHPDNPNPHQVNAYGILNQSEKGIFEPILLTEDWLLKFGFERTLLSNIYKKVMHSVNGVNLKSIAVYLDEKDYTVALVDYYTGVEKTELLHMDYKYVHQLKNLYFALTGTELELKNENPV